MRARQRKATLELTSLVDVVFLLLIFFMLTTTFAQVITKLDLQLPQARGISEQKKKNTLIEIGLQGELALNGDLLTMDVLDKKLKEIAEGNPDEVIIIRADKGVRYGRVVRVMGICKGYKLNKLAIAALQEG